jgi:TetR/AcrR family transcriptional repressor of nem operon
MGRPREFDEETATAAAMELFWERGYDGVGLTELLGAMGIVRGSLYKAYGSKRALFLRALALYEARHVEPGVAFLMGEGTGEERIAAVFSSGAQGGRRGCLLCNTAAGAAGTDDEVAGVVDRQLDRLTEGFAAALADTVAMHDAPEAERLAEARRLTLEYVGVRVRARTGAPTEALSPTAA